MTTDNREPRGAVDLRSAPSGASIHVIRARKLLLGGLLGGLIGTVACLIIFGSVAGSRGALSAALGSGLVLFFYTVGQFVMVIFADAGARTLMTVSMASYTGRVVVLGLVLLSYSNNRESWPDLLPLGVFVSAIAVVVGWLTVEVFVFSRLRIGVYDTEYVGPSKGGGEQ
jgi:hypothetical protein